MGWSLKITKGYHIFIFERLVLFQISCLLYGCGSTTVSVNIFPVCICFILCLFIMIFILASWHYRIILQNLSCILISACLVSEMKKPLPWFQH
jgi:hypothetical protein